MIIAKLVTTKDDAILVKTGMPTLWVGNFRKMYGFLDNDNCVGGMWLSNDYPHKIGLELATKSYCILGALAEAFSGMFREVPRITASISSENLKSLKIGMQLGFKVVYVENGTHEIELIPSNWNYKNKYPLSM